jgi:O-glycosyl hydrolase
MKFGKYLICGAVALSLTACSDEPKGESTKRPVGSGTEEPDKPSGNPDDDVVSPTPAFALNNEKVTVDPAVTFQRIEGFGASDCWLPNWIGQYWSQNRPQIATWLFSQSISADGEVSGIGLSMWRVNLGAGTAEDPNGGGIDNDNANNRAESYMSASGVYDWTHCAGQRYFMEQAKKYGVQDFVLFSNSPLIQFTRNGQGRSDSGAYSNLKDDSYGAFAQYMAEVARHFSESGYNISHISPLNEPQYNWEGTSQEGSGWQNTEIAHLTKELDQALSQRGLATMISLAEAASWKEIYQGDKARSNTIDVLFNPQSDSYVGDLKHVARHVGAHSYWTHDNWNEMRDVRQKAADAAKAAGLDLWQTEWSMLGDAPSELGDYDKVSEFDIAQYMSRIIHNDLTVAGCTSWSYWTAMSVERWSQKNRFELIKTTPAGGEYSNDFTAEGRIVATPNLWVLGNYSLFVRPGYTRIAASHNESKNFFASAYIAPDRSNMVIVVTNYDKEKGVSIDMQAPEGTKAVYTYTTSATKQLKQARFNIADKVFVDPASVTTIVYNL